MSGPSELNIPSHLEVVSDVHLNFKPKIQVHVSVTPKICARWPRSRGLWNFVGLNYTFDAKQHFVWGKKNKKEKTKPLQPERPIILSSNHAMLNVQIYETLIYNLYINHMLFYKNQKNNWSLITCVQQLRPHHTFPWFFKGCDLITFILVTHTQKKTNPIRAEKQPNSWPFLTISPCLTAITCEPRASVSYWRGHRQWNKCGKVRMEKKKTLASRTRVQDPCWSRSLWETPCMRVCVGVCVLVCTLHKNPSRLIQHQSAIWAQLVSRHLGRERAETKTKTQRERHRRGVTAGTKPIWMIRTGRMKRRLEGNMGHDSW